MESDKHRIPPDIFTLVELLGTDEVSRVVRSRIPSWHPRMDEEEGTEGSGEGSGSEGSGESGSGEGSGSEGSGSGSSSGEEGSSGGESGDDDLVKMSKDEAARLRRIAREAADAKKKADAEKAAADRKKKQEEGRWQELINEEQTKTQEAITRAERAENELVSFKFQIKVNELATAAGFEDPSDAHLYVNQEDLKDASDKVIESELKKVLVKKPHLKSKRKATGGNGDGAGSPGSLTVEDVKRMSPSEINSRWDEVQKVMANANG